MRVNQLPPSLYAIYALFGFGLSWATQGTAIAYVGFGITSLSFAHFSLAMFTNTSRHDEVNN